jgi:predicted NBD/HSP70 family sugar kinase
MFSLFKTLRNKGVLTQSELKDHLQLQRSTISYLVNDLRKEGLIKNSEKCIRAVRVGKPGQFIELDNSHALFLGLYLEETFLDAHIIGIADQEVLFQRIPLNDCPPNELPDRIIDIINQLKNVYDSIQGIGIAVKSVVDRKGNLSSFKRPLPTNDVPKIWMVEGFTSRICMAFPDKVVVVENDANCAAVYCQSADKQASPTSIVFIINVKPFGIGCGIMIDGELFRGFNGASGEIYFSNRSIQDLVEQNRNGQDPEQIMTLLRESIAKSTYFIDPQKVYLTGGLFSSITEEAIARIHQLFADVPYPIEILSQPHYSFPARGAVLLAADEYMEKLLSGMERRL